MSTLELGWSHRIVGAGVLERRSERAMGALVPSCRFRAASLVVLLIALLGGCTRVPVAELGAYRTQFELAKTSAEDYVLATKTAATELADDPNAPGTVAERNEKLRQRL